MGDGKSILVRPAALPLSMPGCLYHQRDENIRGHVFCSFLALVLRKELDRRLEQLGHHFEWADIKQDLKALRGKAREKPL